MTALVLVFLEIGCMEVKFMLLADMRPDDPTPDFVLNPTLVFVFLTVAILFGIPEALPVV
jgi:hypothetical protein